MLVLCPIEIVSKISIAKIWFTENAKRIRAKGLAPREFGSVDSGCSGVRRWTRYPMPSGTIECGTPVDAALKSKCVDKIDVEVTH